MIREFSVQEQKHQAVMAVVADGWLSYAQANKGSRADDTLKEAASHGADVVRLRVL